MANLFGSGSSEKSPFDELCVVYVLYFDEKHGHLPLLIYPDDKYKDDKSIMRPIKYHSIWFMDIEEVSALDHIDLEYKGNTYFGKKFLTKSKRKKRRAGLEVETPETIVLIVSLPNDLNLFGDELIKRIYELIRKNFEDKLFEIIESEIAKDEVIKTPKIKKRIATGTKLKERLRELIDNTCNEFFSRTIKQTDISSIKRHKAIAYLSLKGIDLNHIVSSASKSTFSNIKIFDLSKGRKEGFAFKAPFEIVSVEPIGDSREIEILVQNNTEKEINDINVNITHIKDYFEKELMHQEIDIWFPNEQLLFISPIIPYINEYLFFISHNGEKLLSKKIDLKSLDKNKKK